jgi:ABC-2 type transport system ATP-binding protein
MKGLSKAEEQLEYWFDRLEFKAGGTKNPGTFKRMAQKIQFVVCVLHKPKLLIFDEPFQVLIL